MIIKKSDLHYGRGIAAKRVMGGGTLLHGLAPVQHVFEETSQQWRAVGDFVSDLTGPGFEPRPPVPIAMSFTTAPTAVSNGNVSENLDNTTTKKTMFWALCS